MYTQSSVISFYPYGVVHFEHKNRHANHVLYLVYRMSNTLLIAYKAIDLSIMRIQITGEASAFPLPKYAICGSRFGPKMGWFYSERPRRPRSQKPAYISTHAHLRSWRMLWGQFEEL
jgi:hypothetical protein